MWIGEQMYMFFTFLAREDGPQGVGGNPTRWGVAAAGIAIVVRHRQPWGIE